MQPVENMQNKPPAQVNNGLLSGIDCLLEIASSDEPVGCNEIAKALGMEVTRVNRLLGTLAYSGFARKTTDRKYIPGPGLHVLSAISLRSSHLLPASLPHLRKLANTVKKGVALGVLWKDHVTYLFSGGYNEPLEASISSRSLYPAKNSSIGHCLLSVYSAAEIRNLFGDSKDTEEVLDMLDTYRRTGYAMGRDGNSMAVSVGGSTPIAGLAIINADKKNLDFELKELRRTAAAINKDLNVF